MRRRMIIELPGSRGRVGSQEEGEGLVGQGVEEEQRHQQQVVPVYYWADLWEEGQKVQPRITSEQPSAPAVRRKGKTAHLRSHGFLFRRAHPPLDLQLQRVQTHEALQETTHRPHEGGQSQP